MGSPSTASRALSLRAPIADEAERAHFQERLALTFLLVFLLAFGFLIAQIIGCAIVTPESLVLRLTSPSILLEVTVTCSGAFGWLLLRKTKRGVLALDVMDAAGAFGLCLGWTLMIFPDNSPGRSELIVLLACNYTLIARAALLPSTPARTAAIATTSLVPLIPATAYLHRTAPAIHAASGGWVYAAAWAGVCVACTTVLSHVIHGLQRQVKKAMQLGQYHLESKIGEGGMGAVYRASHTLLRRPTAIKLMRAQTGPAAARFEREVQLTAGLTHPNTIAVYDYGRTPDGVFYYAMEFLEGISLEDLVREFGPQPPSRVVHVLLQMCGALEEAHNAGLVHRDIKPANVMLTRRGGVHDVVKVLDFGLVKEVEGAGGAGSTSNVGAVLGTPHYMAPEAIVAPSTVDRRADIYAMGATAYALLTGGHVFDGANVLALCSQHLYDAPPKPRAKHPDIPEALETVVLECLEKKPEDRPSSAAALATKLRACGVTEWTSEDAARCYASEVSTRPRTGTDADASNRPEIATTELGDTVAVALEDRGAG